MKWTFPNENYIQKRQVFGMKLNDFRDTFLLQLFKVGWVFGQIRPYLRNSKKKIRNFFRNFFLIPEGYLKPQTASSKIFTRPSYGHPKFRFIQNGPILNLNFPPKQREFQKKNFCPKTGIIVLTSYVNQSTIRHFGTSALLKPFLRPSVNWSALMCSKPARIA